MKDFVPRIKYENKANIS